MTGSVVYDAIQVGRVLLVTSDGQIRSVVYNWKMRIVTGQIERGANCTLLTFLSVEKQGSYYPYLNRYINEYRSK